MKCRDKHVRLRKRVARVGKKWEAAEVESTEEDVNEKMETLRTEVRRDNRARRGNLCIYYKLS